MPVNAVVSLTQYVLKIGNFMSGRSYVKIAKTPCLFVIVAGLSSGHIK